MPDMTEIDRQLDGVGRVPEDTAGLLARNLGADRSQATLDRMLHELGGLPAPVPASFATASYPPPPARTPTPVPARMPTPIPPPRFPTPVPVFAPAAEAPASEAPAEVASATQGTQEFPFGINAPTQSIVEALTNENTDDAAIQTSDDDDFEMLIEDEEILEIQEDDVEEDEATSES